MPQDSSIDKEETNSCFVLSSDNKNFVNLWDAVLEPAIKNSGMKTIRTTDISRHYGNIMESIRKNIMEAKVIVAVLNNDSLSVMYELGLAHAAKKHVIIMLEKGKEVPLVFSNLGILNYDPSDFPRVRKELIRRLKTISGTSEDLFPELPSRNQQEWEEYNYLKLTRKALTIKVHPSNCSIFFNNRFLGASPQTIYINSDVERNVISIAATEHFEYYEILSDKDIKKSEIIINLDHRDSHKGTSEDPKWVNTWLKLRRVDPNNPVLSHAIGYYLIEQKDLNAAEEEAKFCIAKAPIWSGGYNLLGIVEGRRDNQDKAIEQYRMVGILNPKDFVSIYNIACAQSYMGKYKEALLSLDKIITNPNLSQSLRGIFKSTKRPYLIEIDPDIDALRNHHKYKQDFEKKITQLIAIIESCEPPLITEPSPNTFNKSKSTPPLPYAIKSFIIKSFQCIKHLELSNISIDSPWIFITGDNADGKTSLLQALAIGLTGTEYASGFIKDIQKECIIDVELSVHEESKLRHFFWAESHWRAEDGETRNIIKPFNSLVGYGPARLDLQTDLSLKDERKFKKDYLHSLFQQEGNLLNIETWLKERKLDVSDEQNNAILLRMEKVKSLLVKLMPNVSNINMKGSRVTYLEKGYEVEAHRLSSGHKSILATIGDMLINLYNTQDEITDPSELQGIVIIDELDVHLHPKWQKKLPTLLSEVFPKVQFIVSTHSVIPFLGAPVDSVFLKVTRDPKQGTKVEKLDIDITNLLPNAILTSPLFDMEQITNSHNKNFADIRTENDYHEIEQRNQRNEQLKQFSKKSKNSN